MFTIEYERVSHSARFAIDKVFMPPTHSLAKMLAGTMGLIDPFH